MLEGYKFAWLCLECYKTVNKTKTSASFEPLTSSNVLILIVKVKVNVLYKAVYLSRSIVNCQGVIRNPKIDSQKLSKCRHLHYPSLFLRAKFKRAMQPYTVKQWYHAIWWFLWHPFAVRGGGGHKLRKYLMYGHLDTWQSALLEYGNVETDLRRPMI